MGRIKRCSDTRPPFARATYVWSPTLTTRCFSTSGLAKQNQQGPVSQNRMIFLPYYLPSSGTEDVKDILVAFVNWEASLEQCTWERWNRSKR